jgi:hypothetical protein
MNIIKNTAPYIDDLIKSAQGDPVVKDKTCARALDQIINDIQEIKIQGEDERRSLWLYAERGSINDFGSYEEYLEEDIVRDQKEFIELWEYYYPDEKKWYNLTFIFYDGDCYIFIDSELTFHLSQKEKLKDQDNTDIELVEWLRSKITNILSRLKTDQSGYNKYLDKNLPYKRRKGRILRQRLWEIFPEEEEMFKKEFFRESLDVLEIIADRSMKRKLVPPIKEMSAGGFFRFCEIGYDANNYFKGRKKKLTPKEKYIAMADGRHCGLTELDENSVDAFKEWYFNKSNCGGHPWEICRGGNSTHISLYVFDAEGGWKLRLAGSSRGRVVETIKMALALYEKKAPFILDEAEEILRMIKGIDHIGIVPETLIPVYCHSLFPDKDRINYFMNLGYEKTEEIIKRAEWYPLEEIRLA